MATTLATPKVRVLLEQAGTGDFLELDVQTDNRDAVQWDAVRGRRHWEKAPEAPQLWLTFLAWHAAHRSGGFADDFDTFNSRCVQISVLGRDGEPVKPEEVTTADMAGDGLGDPMKPDPVTG